MKKLIHIIPTPIGNLEDITLRALQLLHSVDLILAEDTRTTGKLLKHYEIITKMMSYHAFNEHGKLDLIINKIKSGFNIALVSDAGTPAISDPGFLLIRECIKNDIEIFCLPGATACIPALIKSGIACDRFIFEGFLPVKKGRRKKLNDILENSITSIIYESPHRIIKTIQQLCDLSPDREIAVIKELTKLNEKIYRGSVQDVLEELLKSNIKGEFVIILDGK
tara:strand:- start:38 stop:706 length:669 start_codon:yes stop_codon:yes gene_type:complete